MKNKQSLSKLLSQYQPRPGQRFYQKMQNAPWGQQKEKTTHRSARLARYGWQIGIAVILVLAVLSLSIPSVRASISQWLGLSIAPSNQAPAAAVTLVAITPPTPEPTMGAVLPLPTQPSQTPTALPSPTAAATSEKPAEVNKLSPQVAWNILVPGRLPAGYQFQSAYLDTNHQMLVLSYDVTRALPGAADPSLTETKAITLLQAQKNDFVPMQLAPAAVITDVQVNGQPAVYVVGAWDTQFVKDDKDPNGGQMVSTWRNDLAVKNLYWQVGNVYLVIVTDDTAVSMQDLIDMANSIVG